MSLRVALWRLLAWLLLAECVRILLATLRQTRTEDRARAVAVKAHRNGIGTPGLTIHQAEQPFRHDSGYVAAAVRAQVLDARRGYRGGFQ